MALSLKLAASVAGSYSGQGGLVALAGALSAAMSTSFATGTAAGQADCLFSDARSLSAGGSDVIALGAGLHDPFGAPLAFEAIKAIFILAASSNRDDLVFGGGSNAFAAPFGPSGGSLRVRPGQAVLLGLQDANGWVLGGGGSQINVAPATSAAPTSYQVVILGCSATLSAPAWAMQPSIDGVPAVGNTLSCWPGDVSGQPTLTYQWRRNGGLIAGATQQTYTLASADASALISCTVNATNTAGKQTTSASITGTVAGGSTGTAPSVTTSPTISSTTPMVGQVINATGGVYGGSPVPTVSRQWIWADTGAPISGATGASYTPVSSDAGHTLKYVEMASNGVGTAAMASSPTTSAVQAASVAPSVTTVPTLSSSSPVVGQAIKATPGVYGGSPAPTVTRQWFYNDTGTPISGATGLSYTPSSADVGHTLKYVETASNTAGSIGGAAQTTAAVQAAAVAPTVTTAPTLSSSTPTVGQVISATAGVYGGSPQPSVSRQWAYGDTGALISGATSASYTPVSADVGHTLIYNETATNPGGAVTSSAGPTSNVASTTPSNSLKYGGQPLLYGGQSILF